MKIDTPEIKFGCENCSASRMIFCDNGDVFYTVLDSLYDNELPYRYSQRDGTSVGGFQGVCSAGDGVGLFETPTDKTGQVDCHNAERIASLIRKLSGNEQLIIE